ncbi:magnesium chelatase ATPase subunit I [Candidatus Fermentibacteria bacterium]|nr:MAG: magnesium chelatase ATPase subunit I [Candidatus Fermentibacteria bacterium]PIE53699.1 MAG: magnesium chelatase ATPase subunit I [Candidatus Fermentibacteria bacterium]
MQYPFSAVVGQDKAKTALILSAVDPDMGGVLLTGQKGTGKSTLVRAFPGILPSLKVNSCSYNCSPDDSQLCPECSCGDTETHLLEPQLVNVPLGSDEASLLGAIRMDTLLREGTVEFEPGLLARANNQVLYIDEVNLLPDHVADNILDCAASGVNTIEKDNVSITHPARFVLIGTMNPEEGRLRPQILDRFALSVPIATIEKSEQRIDIINRVLAFSEDPAAFCKAFSGADHRIRARISQARKHLSAVQMPVGILATVAGAMAELQLDGQRADIVTLKAAKALSAYQGKDVVDLDSLHAVAPLSVGHRTRQGGYRNAPEEKEILQALKEAHSKFGGKKNSGRMWSFSEAIGSQE